MCLYPLAGAVSLYVEGRERFIGGSGESARTGEAEAGENDDVCGGSVRGGVGVGKVGGARSEAVDLKERSCC